VRAFGAERSGRELKTDSDRHGANLDRVGWGAGIMLVFFAVGTVAGLLLGLRFKLFVLVPAILIATLAIVLSGRGLRLIVFTEVGTVALLQVGYIGGCVLRAILMRICPRKWFGF
jgi:hypothetical protein